MKVYFLAKSASIQPTTSPPKFVALALSLISSEFSNLQPRFSFLEALNWNREEIHIALIGDLYHGRTVHSKADGLRIYRPSRASTAEVCRNGQLSRKLFTR